MRLAAPRAAFVLAAAFGFGLSAAAAPEANGTAPKASAAAPNAKVARLKIASAKETHARTLARQKKAEARKDIATYKRSVANDISRLK